MANTSELEKLLGQMIDSVRRQASRGIARPTVSIRWEQVKSLQGWHNEEIERLKVAFRAFNPRVNILGKPLGARRVDTV